MPSPQPSLAGEGAKIKNGDYGYRFFYSLQPDAFNSILSHGEREQRLKTVTVVAVLHSYPASSSNAK